MLMRISELGCRALIEIVFESISVRRQVGYLTATSLATVHGILALHRVTTYPLGRSRYQARLVYNGYLYPQHQHQLVFYPFLHRSRTWPVCTGRLGDSTIYSFRLILYFTLLPSIGIV